MTTENQRSVIGVVRRVVFSALVLLIAWLVLIGLRGAISPSLVNLMNQEMSMESTQPLPVPVDPWGWDWSKSLWSGKPVAGIVGERLGGTLALIGATMLVSLALAILSLFVGFWISRATDRPAWLGKTRPVLRLVLISGAVSVPVFAWETLAVVYPAVWWGMPAGSPFAFWVGALSVSVLPAWLLVQYGHGQLASMTGGVEWGQLAVSLAIRVIRLAGAIIVLSMFVGLSAPFLNLGRLFLDAINRRDFPIIFGIAWTTAVIVVLFKLAADLAEIGHRHFVRPPAAGPAESGSPARVWRLPKWMVVVSLALVAASLVVAVAAPFIAPYGSNEMVLNARLSAPSSTHILGTDNLGRDVFSRMIMGIREDVFMALVAVAILIGLAVGWAILGAHVRRSDDWRGDTLEDVVMLPRDALCAFPWLVLMLLPSSFMMPDSGPVAAFALPVILAASLVLLPRAVGLMQEAYRSPPEESSWLRGLLISIPVMLVFVVAGGILYVTAASYLGFGVPPPVAELGGMLAGPARRYMLQAPWMALWPPATLILLLAVWVLAGEALLERLGFRSRALWSKVWE
jgi:peptide/nickel transport system permease protein